MRTKGESKVIILLRGSQAKLRVDLTSQNSPYFFFILLSSLCLYLEGPDGYLLGHFDEIESHRPKTPPMKNRGGVADMVAGGGSLPGVGRGAPAGRGIIGTDKPWKH